jgi:cellulose 1,4-beta-cellobiosidase
VRRALLLLVLSCGQAPKTPPPNNTTFFASADAAAAPIASSNPFDGAQLYVNPDFAKQVVSTSKDPQVAKAATFPTAIWIDTIEKSKVVPRVLEDAKGALPVFVIYDLPNRDCSAKSSAGELTLEQEARYKTELIDPIAAQFRAHPSQKIVIVLEPDSLANIATNTNVAKCAASEGTYKRSLAYAIKTLSMPNVYVYLDAAHGGWLGWDDNRKKIAAIFKSVLDDARAPASASGRAHLLHRMSMPISG